MDNPLLKVVDADFLGRITTHGVPLATKVVLKTAPEQKVGVVVRRGGGPAIVEDAEINCDAAAGSAACRG